MSRKLAVELVEPYGSIVEFCDPETDSPGVNRFHDFSVISNGTLIVGFSLITELGGNTRNVAAYPQGSWLRITEHLS